MRSGGARKPTCCSAEYIAAEQARRRHFAENPHQPGRRALRRDHHLRPAASQRACTFATIRSRGREERGGSGGATARVGGSRRRETARRLRGCGLGRDDDLVVACVLLACLGLCSAEEPRHGLGEAFRHGRLAHNRRGHTHTRHAWWCALHTQQPLVALRDALAGQGALGGAVDVEAEFLVAARMAPRPLLRLHRQLLQQPLEERLDLREGRTLLGALGPALVHQVAQRARARLGRLEDLGAESAGGDTEAGRDRVQGAVGDAARDDLPGDDGEGVHVARLGVLLRAEDLRCSPAVGPCLARHVRVAVLEAAQAKVNELDVLRALLHQNILGFQVSVDNVVTVEVRHRRRDLEAHAHRCPGGDLDAEVLWVVEVLVNVHAVHQFHDDCPVRLLNGGNERDNIRVPQGSEQLQLTLEKLHGIWLHVFEALDGHFLSLVSALKNFSKCPSAEPVAKFEVR
mmetsp:Transcript_19754/g.33953  ORF Transcript_19754/g.33953 Transcript_19754/m.33953 type:complete len:458 (+) Transcript_19754:746-2119(+)